MKKHESELIKKIKTVLYDIKPSEIHGVGLYSNQPILKGSVVFDYKHLTTSDVVFIPINKLRQRVNESVIRVLKKWYSHTETHIQIPKNFDPYCFHIVSLVNHSTKPTLEYKNGKYYAKKNLKKDTELTLDYSINNYTYFIDF
jgi:hypothetical protein